MRSLPINLVTRNIELNREPRVAIKILNDQGAFWLTTHDDVNPGDGLDVYPTLIAASASSQSITPEKGFSTIGGMTVELQDQAFTDRLRTIKAANDTINNNPAQVFMGFAGLDFADYGKLFTFIVDGVESDQLNYTVRLSDRQRLQKRGIFTAQKTRLLAVVEGSELKDLSVDTVLDGSGVVEVLSSAALPLVDHDDDWDTDPSMTVGYFQIKGVDAAGNDSLETFSFTGYDGSNPNRLTGVTRSRFGTTAIEARGSVNDGTTEVAEFIYVDMPLPKLILALMTGDLYGQPGATLPDHWHAGLAATDVDLASFENIGDDLWALPFSFEGPESTEAKNFIASELLRAANLFFKINQDGEFQLSRFASVPQDAAPAHVFDESEIISIGKITRDARNIRNRFLFNWEWRQDIERFVRNDLFIDQDSINRNNIVSDTLVLNFKGVRNRSRSVLNSLQSLAEGIRARYSDPAVKPPMTVPLAYGLLPEVGDVIGVNLAQWPDYAAPANLNASFEIQSTSIDLIRQTASFNLFGTSGTPTPIDFGKGEDVINIDHTGWKELSAALTSAGISYSESGGTLTITGNGTLVGGDTTAPANRYFYDGNVTVADGVTLTVTKNFVLDALDIDLSGAMIDGAGRGLPGGNGSFVEFSPSELITPYTLGQKGYIGGEDLAEEGILVSIVGQDKLYRYPKNNGWVPAARAQVESIGLRVNDGVIEGFGSSTFLGSSGSGGMYSVIKDASGLDPQPYNAGDGGDGGASITFFCVNLFTNSSTEINTSGGNAEPPQPHPVITDEEDRAGAGGPGWPGCLLVFLKLKTAPIPILTNRHIANVGTVPGLETYQYYPKKSNQPVNVPSFGQYTSAGPLPSAAAIAYKGADLSTACRLVKYITSDTPAPDVPGVDKVGPAELPTLALAERINTPETPKGNISTITVTATEPADTRYSYSIFEYRALGQAAWYPLEYKLSDETTKELPTDGSTYEFSARSVSVSGQVSTARTIEAITLSVVSEEPEETNTEDAAIQVAQIRRLVLVNAISDDEDTQWKGPDAEFQWAKIRFGETNIESDPKQDMHLDGYRVQVFRTSDQKLLREVTVTDTFYTYTLADNRRDNVDAEGNPAPTRAITVKVAAVAATGVTSKSARISVSNPAPAAPGNIAALAGYGSIEVRYTLPSDVDFVGVDVTVNGSDPFRIAGNTFNLDRLALGAEFTIGLTSVDRFGTGGNASIVVTTLTLDAADIEGLSNWATETNPVDLAFIQANMANDSIASQKIESLTVAKLTAGQVVVQIDLGTGVLLDGANGVVQTINDDYSVLVGPVNRPSLSANPVVLHAWDDVSSTSTFWFDAAGNFSLGKGGITYDVNTDKTVFSGELSAATGVFGDLGGDYVEFDGTSLVITTENFELEADGSVRMGVGSSSLQFDVANDELIIGRDVEIEGVDSFNNVSTYDNIGFGQFSGYLTNLNGNTTISIADADGVVFGRTDDIAMSVQGPGGNVSVYFPYLRDFNSQKLSWDAVMGTKYVLKFIPQDGSNYTNPTFSDYGTKILLGFGDLPGSSSRTGYELEVYVVPGDLKVTLTLKMFYIGSSVTLTSVDIDDETLAIGNAATLEISHVPQQGPMVYVDDQLIIDGSGQDPLDVPAGAMPSTLTTKFFLEDVNTWDYGDYGDFLLLFGDFKFVNGLEPI